MQRLHIDGRRAGAMLPGPKTPEAPLQLRLPCRNLDWGGRSKCSAAELSSGPLDGGSATFALKAGVWFRRGRLFMVSPVRGDYRRCQAETPLIDLFKFARRSAQCCETH